MPSAITLVGSENDSAAFRRLVMRCWCHSMPSRRSGGFQENGTFVAGVGRVLFLISLQVRAGERGSALVTSRLTRDKVEERHSQWKRLVVLSKEPFVMVFGLIFHSLGTPSPRPDSSGINLRVPRSVWMQAPMIEGIEWMIAMGSPFLPSTYLWDPTRPGGVNKFDMGLGVSISVSMVLHTQR